MNNNVNSNMNNTNNSMSYYMNSNVNNRMNAYKFFKDVPDSQMINQKEMNYIILQFQS